MGFWRVIGHVERISLLIVLLGRAAYALEPVIRKAKHKYRLRKERKQNVIRCNGSKK